LGWGKFFFGKIGACPKEEESRRRVVGPQTTNSLSFNHDCKIFNEEELRLRKLGYLQVNIVEMLATAVIVEMLATAVG